MPLFDYRCRDCDRTFELLVRGTAMPVCPSCGSLSLEKQLSLFAVSSESTQQRSRKLLGAAEKQKSQRNQAERTFYKSDHHDD